MEIDDFQHPDAVWTWPEKPGRGRSSLWLPYFEEATKVKRKRGVWRFTYNGGEFDAQIKKLDAIMIYGATGVLDVELLDQCSQNGVAVVIHRRNQAKPFVLYPEAKPGTPDLLTAQILHRENAIKRCYIARTLLRERFRAMERLIPIPEAVFTRLAKERSVLGIRALEAAVTKRYWGRFYESIGTPVPLTRREPHPVNAALDACSFFLFGSILRWVLMHRFSPAHGYLHEPSTYASLCYDIIEPYRVWFEEAVAGAVGQLGIDSSASLTGASLAYLKASLQQQVYVPLTRQRVARKNLLHGAVLGLRSYLLGESGRFLVPAEGQRHAGRPRKISWRMPGDRGRA